MKKNSPSDNPEDDPLGLDSSLFGLDVPGDEWLVRLRDSELAPAPGRIGEFDVVEEIRRGAQGVVYRARQPGTGRTVALKRLIAGAYADTETLLRFEREVEAASALNHPGIVTIYGIARDDGLPLLSMEWVDGSPVTEWARERDRLREDVLRVFADVCGAVQHAHQNGVLHRDLKPSNILVDEHDQPRVLDFGLAKLLPEGGVEHLTLTAGFVGTPAYASPEQIDGGSAGLDVRSDVYSLGVVLFELLTDRRPFDRSQGLRELIRSVDEDTPPRPSALASGIDRELDTIVGKALAKDRDERYQSAHALGEDVRRYLAGEPILAHPPSLWYHARKGARRNPVATVLLLALVATGVAFATSSFRQSRVLAAERDDALNSRSVALQERQAADDARQVAERERESAEEARQEAERERRKAESVANFFLNTMVRPVGTSHPLEGASVFEVLVDAARRIDEDFGDQPDVEYELRVYLSRALLLMNRIELGLQVAEPMLELADRLDLRLEERAKTMRTYAEILFDRGRTGEAKELVRDMLARVESELGPEDKNVTFLKDSLAGMLSRSGGGFEVVELYREVVAGYERMAESKTGQNLINARRHLAIVLMATGQYAEAEGILATVEAESREVLGDGHFFTASVLHTRGMLQRRQGRPAEAEPFLRKALDIMWTRRGYEDPLVLEFTAELALVLGLTGQCEESLELFDQVLASMRKTTPGPNVGALWCLTGVGRCQRASGELQAAEQTLASALRMSATLQGPGHLNSLAIINELVLLHFELGRFDRAGELLEGLPGRLSLQSATPETGGTLLQAADLCEELGMTSEQQEFERQALRVMETFVVEPNDYLSEARKRVARHE